MEYRWAPGTHARRSQALQPFQILQLPDSRIRHRGIAQPSVDNQFSAADRRRAGVSIGPGQNPGAGVGLGKTGHLAHGDVVVDHRAEENQRDDDPPPVPSTSTG